MHTFTLSQEDKSAIENAIGKAEKNTSGEIRVHIDATNELDPVKRAIEVFQKLQMHQTKLRNGVLIYVAIKEKKLAIIGDQGINEVVPVDFWQSTRDLMIQAFKKGLFKEGLVEGILEAGTQLKHHFPYQENDENELSNEISFQDDLK